MPSLPVEVAYFISEARVGHLGTADATGRPLVVPICYAFDGHAVYSAIDAKPKTRPGGELRRIRNVRENPRVSLVIDHWDEQWERLRYVIIEGHATIVTEGAEFTRGADLLIAKYPQYVALGLARDTGLMLRVAPEKVTHWRFSPAAAETGGRTR
jgi:PPOX class probable F420-dependent enzyme